MTRFLLSTGTGDYFNGCEITNETRKRSKGLDKEYAGEQCGNEFLLDLAQKI